jgi:aminopeptidase
MSEITRLPDAAREAMTHVLLLQPGERVLIVTDEEQRRVGEGFAAGAEAHGCPCTTFMLPADARPLGAMPAGMPDLLAGVDVVINVFSALGQETPFRIEWLKAMLDRGGIRCGHCPGITEDMAAHPLAVDYAEMTSLARRLIAALDDARAIRITAPGGTDCTIGVAGRGFLSDVGVTDTHPMCNLPCGEVYCGPEEDQGDGVLVFDGSAGDIGMLPCPLTVEIAGGKITAIAAEDDALLAQVREFTSLDEEASVIGELGIGVNPRARITGNLLEDEKAFRTIHIAFGNNLEMPGGKNSSRTHRDFLVRRPTLAVTFGDGSTRTLMADGEFRI